MLTWSIRELADILDAGITTIRGWISKGKLKGCVYVSCEGYRIRADDLLEFLNKNPKQKSIFLYKLYHTSNMGDKDAKKVLRYLRGKGLLK